ncbi:MAG: MBL fold metallo-hydrolase [Clostridium fessum]
MMETKLVLLGTGTPNACPNASGPSSAVVVGDRAYLVDFGPGVVRQAAKAYQQGIDALRPDRLMIAFCTHLHTDHTTGYPDLIFYPVGAGTPEAAESIRSKRHPEHDRTYFKSI